MDKKRQEEILNAGMSAARDEMDHYPRRHDYPRNFNTLFEWLEDAVFKVYEAVYHKKFAKIYSTIGQVIFTASEIAEHARFEINCDETVEEEK